MRYRKIAVDEFPILVGEELEALGLERFGDRLCMAGPMLRWDPAHGDAPILAVIGSVEVEVALDLLEKRQHIVPAPALSAALNPLLVLSGCPAIGHLTVDGRAAAQHPRLLVLPQRRGVFLRMVVRHDLRVDL